MNKEKKQQLKEEKLEQQKLIKQKISHLFLNLNTQLTHLKLDQESDNKFNIFNTIFSDFFSKFQSLLKRTEDIDLSQTFQLLNQYINDARFHQNKYLLSLVIVQSVIKISENHAYFEKKNVFNMAIKLFISQKLESLNLDPTLRNMIYSFQFLNIGLPLWKKQKDHVPEMYMAINAILILVQTVIEQVDFKALDTDYINNTTTSQQFIQIYEDTVLNELSDEEAIVMEVSDEQVIGIFLSMLKYLQQTFKLTNTQPNFDILYSPILIKLQKIHKFLKEKNLLELNEECIEKIKDRVEGFKVKQGLEILLEKPLINIKQLDPRIEDYKEKKLNPTKQRQKVTKKIKKEKRKVVKDVKEDQQAIQDLKNKKDSFRNEMATKSLKGNIHFMEEQQKEIKKMKTTQLNIQRRKKTNNRMAGNKTDAPAQNKSAKLDIPRL